jgi:hypothetical protein
LGEEPTSVTVVLGEDVVGVEDVLGARELKVGKGGRLEVELGRYGYVWLDLDRSPGGG